MPETTLRLGGIAAAGAIPPVRPAPRDEIPTGPAREDPLAALARAAIAGDPAATRALLAALGPTLLRVVRGTLGPRHRDVEDAVQESMAALVGALRTFRWESGVAHIAARVAFRTA